MATLRIRFRAAAVVLALALLFGTMAAQTSLNVTRMGNYGKGEGVVRSVFAAGSLVYYSIFNKVQIASFSNPANPLKVASVELSDRIEYMVRTSILSNQYLVVSGGRYVWLINVQNPTTPSISATIDVGANATCEGVATSGSYAYIAAGGAGFKVYNISNPTAPAFVASIDSLAYCESVIISAPYAYVAADEMTGWTGRSAIVNISNPATPTVDGIIKGYGGYHQFIDVRSGYAYVCNYDADLQVVNVSVPSSPQNVLSMPTGYRTAMIHFDGNYGYIANGDSGMRVIDVSSPAAPTKVSLFKSPARSLAIAYGAITVGGVPTGHIFNADNDGGMDAINLSTITAPTLAGRIPILAGVGGDSYGVCYGDNKVYVAADTAGLRILDVTNPASPTFLGAYKNIGQTRNVALVGDYAYVAARDSGVYAINVSNPASPTFAARILTPRARGIVALGSYVYVAASDTGVAVIDATNPSAPVWITSLPELYGENIGGGGHVIGISDYSKVRFYDVTNPASPVQGGLTPAFKTGNEGLGISGNYAYLPDGDSLRIFDISTLATPTQVGVIRVGGYCYNAAVAGNYVYVSAEGAGLQVVDASTPSSPAIAGFYDGPDQTRWVAVNGAYAYVAEFAGGLTVYNNNLVTSVGETGNGLPGAFSLSQNYPNPFNPSTTISFNLGTSGSVRLEVHNVLGQVVATLVNGTLNAGEHSVRFDAKTLSSGVYFYTLRSGEKHEVRKMMLMK
jgi:hypothetical protein